MQTIVGRWSPCHVLQHPSLLSSLFFIGGHNASQGGRGTEATVLLKFAIELLNHSLQGYSLPSIARPLVACQSKKGRGKPRSGAGEGILFMFLWFNRIAVSQLIYNFVSAFSHYAIIHIQPIYDKNGCIIPFTIYLPHLYDDQRRLCCTERLAHPLEEQKTLIPQHYNLTLFISS